jgi:hypothetical protein
LIQDFTDLGLELNLIRKKQENKKLGVTRRVNPVKTSVAPH